MNRAVTCFLVLCALAMSGRPTPAQGGTGQLTVEIEYKGAETVDAAHPLIVFLFDQRDTRNGPPFDALALPKKSGSVTFKNIPHATVYVAALFDQSGTYSIANPAPPATGTPVTGYREAGARELAPVTVAAPPRIKLVIDGSERWGGEPASRQPQARR